jgi:hypothetical protein
MMNSPARWSRWPAGEFKWLAWRQGNKSRFVDTIDRQCTLAASRFAIALFGVRRSRQGSSIPVKENDDHAAVDLLI